MFLPQNFHMWNLFYNVCGALNHILFILWDPLTLCTDLGWPGDTHGCGWLSNHDVHVVSPHLQDTGGPDPYVLLGDDYVALRDAIAAVLVEEMSPDNLISIIEVCDNLMSIIEVCDNLISIIEVCDNLISIIEVCDNLISIIEVCIYFYVKKYVDCI